MTDKKLLVHIECLVRGLKICSLVHFQAPTCAKPWVTCELTSRRAVEYLETQVSLYQLPTHVFST
jgi:hypothetical protein